MEKRVSEELPVGDFSGNSPEWKDAFKTLEPSYVHTNQTIRIVDQKMYDGLKGTEDTVFIGKTDDFLTYKKNGKN